MPEHCTADPIVYVVDDDADVRKGLESLLQSVGLKTRAFGSASEFLGASLAEAVSCLVLDVRLPGLSGLDFQAELARGRIEIPIIFVTGHGDIPMTVKAMRAGAVEFLTKPVREQDLLDAVQIALKRDRERRRRDRETRDLQDKFSALSAREQEVMALVCSGLLNKQTATRIGISEVTVKVHRHNIMKKLGAGSFADLVRMAEDLGIARRS